MSNAGWSARTDEAAGAGCSDAASRVWVLADPRAGTAAQALGIAERLGVPFRRIALEYGPGARVPWPWPTCAGLTPGARKELAPPWPRLVIAAGRRAAPIAQWLGRSRALDRPQSLDRQGARIVHAMRPGFGAARFDLLVVGEHDQAPPAPNLLPILGATHRMSPNRLAEARHRWAAFSALPSPRVALLVGGPVRRAGFPPGFVAALGRQAIGFSGSVLATASRRTGDAATAALAATLHETPHILHRWGDGGENPYAGLLAWADAVVVTGDSVSMLSEALATSVPVFLADPGGLGARHRALHMALLAAEQVRPIAAAPAPFARSTLDETARVAREIASRGWL